MNLSATDCKTFESIKEIAGRVFRLRYSHHVYQDQLLRIIFRDTEEVMIVDCDLRIVLDTAYRSVSLQATLPQPVPQDKRPDMYQALNDLNYKIAKIKIVQDPDQKIEIRGELDLFEDAFSPHNFEMVLGRFLVTGPILLQVIDRFINGQAEKDEILHALYALDNHQSENRPGGTGDIPYPL